MNLYHYCSNAAFHSIVKTRAVWLTSLSLSNDSMEGKLVTEILTRIAKADGLELPTIVRLQDYLSNLEQVIDGLGFCLSEEGDQLSQWRGYAADASGVAIGFSQEFLHEFSSASRGVEKSGLILQKVEYSLEEQEKLVQPTYTEIKVLIDKGAFKIPGNWGLLDPRSEAEIESDDSKIRKAASQLSVTVLLLFEKLFLLKAAAFREEREWRLISYFVKTGDDTCVFRALNDRILPYREYPFIESSQCPIKDVILGPKNITPNYVIESFLKQNGFKEVKVSRSTATYR